MVNFLIIKTKFRCTKYEIFKVILEKKKISLATNKRNYEDGSGNYRNQQKAERVLQP